MSAVPPSFTPLTSFSTLAQQPITATGLPGSELDGEFLRASNSINQIKDRLSEVQRDDGKLRNGVVSTESLSSDVLSMLIAAGVTPITWAPSTAIALGSIVSNPPGTSGTFLAIMAHTSSAVFSTDLAKWALIAAPPTVGTLYTNTFTGNGATTVFTLSNEPASKDNTQVFIDGVYQPKSGYSLSGVLLTISPAPTAGSDIEVSIGVPSTSNIVTVVDGAITTAKLADASVTTSKIVDGSVTGGKIGVLAVGNLNITPAAITADKISPNAVTSTKISSSAVTNEKIADGAAGTTKLADNAVTAEKIAPNAVSTVKIPDNAITTAKIADLSVTAAKIGDAAVETVKIADNAVTSTKIPASAVISSKIATAAVITDKIADASVTAAKLSGAQSGSAPVFGLRAWISFDATRNVFGGTDALNTNRFERSKGNVLSVLKTGLGTFRITFATAMPDDAYVTIVGDDANAPHKIGGVITQTSTYVDIAYSTINTSSTRIDPIWGQVSIIR